MKEMWIVCCALLGRRRGELVLVPSLMKTSFSQHRKDLDKPPGFLLGVLVSFPLGSNTGFGWDFILRLSTSDNLFHSSPLRITLGKTEGLHFTSEFSMDHTYIWMLNRWYKEHFFITNCQICDLPSMGVTCPAWEDISRKRIIAMLHIFSLYFTGCNRHR